MSACSRCGGELFHGLAPNAPECPACGPLPDATPFAGLRIDCEQSLGDPGLTIRVNAGHIAVLVRFNDRSQEIRMRPEARAMLGPMTLLLRRMGVSAHLLASPLGTCALWALAEYSLASMAAASLHGIEPRGMMLIGDGEEAVAVLSSFSCTPAPGVLISAGSPS